MKKKPLRRCGNSSTGRRLPSHAARGEMLDKSTVSQAPARTTASSNARIPLSCTDDYCRAILETADDLIFVIDRDDRVLYVNPAAAASQRRHPEDLIGRYRHEIFPPEVAEHQRRALLAVFKSGSPSSFENDLSTPAGHMWIHTRLIPLRSDDGGTRAIVGISRDITARKNAEQALAKSEHLYRTLVETCPDTIGLLDLDGRIMMANESCARMYGYQRPEEFLGRSVLDFIVPEDRDRAVKEMSEALGTGPVRSREYSQLRKDGSTFAGEINLSAVPGADGHPTGFISMVRDITERKRMDRELFQAQKLQAIVALTAGIAHDFGNILAVIMGNASMLQRREELPPGERGLLDDIMTAAERGSTYTQQLLAYARGGLPRPAPTNLNETIESVQRLIAGRSRTARIILRLSPRLPAVMADPTQLEQVVLNLCLNGIQACRRGQHVQVSTTVETLDQNSAASLALTPGNYVLLQVRDHGCGMSRKTLERVFEPFFTTKDTGRGMGLPTALGIIQSHHGQISIESQPGKGTVVTVRLPPAASSHAANAPRGSAGRTGRRPGRPPLARDAGRR